MQELVEKYIVRPSVLSHNTVLTDNFNCTVLCISNEVQHNINNTSQFDFQLTPVKILLIKI
jgi:hypothetical protein